MTGELTFLPLKLRRRAEARGDEHALGFLDDGEVVSASLSLGALDARVDDVAAALVERFPEDARVLLLFPPGLDFVVAFLACLRAGRVAVPAIPPDPHKPARSLARLGHLVANAAPAGVLTTAVILPYRPILDETVPALACLPWIDVTEVPRAGRRVEEPREDGLAFLQYTSGSTAAPKGVRILRSNLSHNLHVIHGVAPMIPRASVSWLPQFHDMGLIEGILLPLDGGWPAWLMPPWVFLERPLRWLRAIERFGAMRSGGPNFAYDLCMRKIDPAAREKLDLSCWAQAYCGAEPIRASTLAAFAEAFAPSRFSAAAWFPCYGLAEHTVLASCRTHAPYTVERLSAAALARGEAEEAGGERAIDVVCVGEIPPLVTVRVVDLETQRPLPDGRIGEIWLQSGSVADGYWGDEEATRGVFGATLAGSEQTFLRTGDLGYRRADKLFLVGRQKDVLIVRGENHHAHDVERAAEGAHPAIRRGCVCAVLLEDVAGGGEPRPVVVCEVDGRLDDAGRAAVRAAVHRAVAFEHGIFVDVALVPKHTLPKTSSGKLQRRATEAMLRAGEIEMPVRPPPALEGSPGEGSRLRAAHLMLARVTGLSLDEIDIDEPPARLPLDSLKAADAAAVLGDLLGRTISLDVWGGAPSLRALVEGTIALDAPWIKDLEHPLPRPKPRRSGGGVILVTGGTGFVGRAVVAELVRRDKRVLVLARGADGARGLAGDVCLPNLGLGEERHRALARELDVVVHVAGAVNWVLPYSSLAPTNACGTAEVIALCAAAGARLVHVSSQIVCHDGAAAPGAVLGDDEPPSALRARLPRLPLGYASSKAVAELLVDRARKEGLSATIVRPSLVLGGKDGEASVDDVVAILLRACIEAGAAPDLDLPFSVCPRDHLARVLADLVDAGPLLVHVGDESRSLREVVAWLALAGYDVALIPWEAWLARVEGIGLHRRGRLRGLWPFFRAGTLRTYERARRAVISIAPAYRGTEPVDPAFLDDRVAAWQAASALPLPPRRRARATAASRALPEAPRRVVVDGVSREVTSARVMPAITGSGLLSRLACGFCDRPVGVYPAMLMLDDGRELDVVLKASARGDELRALCTDVARASSPTLAAALEMHGHWLDVASAHTRERALYGLDHAELARVRPRCFSPHDDAIDAPLILERLREGDQVEALDAVAEPWPLDAVRRAVRGLARLHADLQGPAAALSVVPWARAAGTVAAELVPLWEALFGHARTRIDADVAALAARLLDDVRWADALAAVPATLLHNDVNPRNLALRRGPSDAGIVLYDWELSALGPGTRDLAELLCWTLSPDTTAEEAFALVRVHAEMVAPGLDDEALRAAFGASLAWFFLDRLTTYTVVSPVFDLPWLGRVLSTWRTLIRGFAPTE
ncbi:AMP-binding protein [Polyangium jinanense]|uniref:AMP-binding protein n=1 Tax=Polyangium jinanense TaxID=2829994 RepID=A0A9X3X7K4_9BACT|nr:AMP-binding protein [Polyangium jinanense]MDC3954343.1 AMP-binding protein [Polyangium jinanense]MDC3984205.1 AMP-binding protein [Polyangium jinanense]